MAETILFTGGCRSGKSALAKFWAESRGAQRAFIATARLGFPVGDAEMADRIRRHRADRDVTWVTVEPDDVSPGVPLDAAAAVSRAAAVADVAVFDCVTMWISEWLCAPGAYDDDRILLEADRMVAALAAAPIPVAVVTNEVGSTVVPIEGLGRRFRDVVGWVNQRLACACDHVTLAVCGLPMKVR